MKCILAYIIVLLFGSILHAQVFHWERIASLDSSICLTSNGTRLFAGRNQCILVSDDDGQSWNNYYCWPTLADTEGTNIYYYGDMPFAMKALDTLLYVGSIGGERLMPPNGGGLHLFSPHIVDQPAGKQGYTVFSMDVRDSVLIAALGTDVPEGVHVTSDRGATWRAIISSGYFPAVLRIGSAIVCAGDSYLLSTHEGLSWRSQSAAHSVRAMCLYQSFVFSSEYRSTFDTTDLYVSKDSCQTWSNAGLANCRAMTSHKGFLYAATRTALYRAAIGTMVEDPDDLGFEVNPNPANDVIQLRWSASFQHVNVSLSKVRGEVVWSAANTDPFVTHSACDLSGLPAGVYMVQCADDTGWRAFRKVMKY